MRFSNKVLLWSLFFLVALLVGGGMFAVKSRALSSASEHCTTDISGEEQVAVLIVGDSWVSKGRLLPGFEDGFTSSSRKTLKVCSIGYPGRTSPEVAAGLKEDYNFDVSGLFGQQPDYVIAIVGINDAIQHSGVGGFVEGLNALSQLPATHFMAFEIPHVDEDAYRPTRFLDQVRHFIYLWGNDFGQEHVLNKYRTAALDADFMKIPIDDFAESTNATPLGEDRIHLTQDGNIQLGIHLGRYIASFEAAAGRH